MKQRKEAMNLAEGEGGEPTISFVLLESGDLAWEWKAGGESGAASGAVFPYRITGCKGRVFHGFLSPHVPMRCMSQLSWS